VEDEAVGLEVARVVERKPARAGWKRDLLRLVPVLRWLVFQRWFQFALIVPNLLAFTIVILSGIFGIPVGAKNFSIIFVWIVWWALLIVVLVPFGARVWCAMCPIPAFGEWLQRKSFVSVNAGGMGLGRRWPRRLRNLWLANFGFLTIALFSPIVTTRPMVTGLLLLGLMAVAVVTHLVFERRAFCRYLCPVGGFLGLYSMAAPVELRRIDAEVCRQCRFKSCYRGSTPESLRVGGVGGYGCPNFEFPGGGMERNTYCLLCTECVKACPYGNITINVRPFGTDLLVEKGWKLDEAFKAFIMLGSAILYSIIMIGPWGTLKDWANLGGWGFLVYAAMFLGSILLLAPGLHLGVSALLRRVAGARSVPLSEVFVNTSYALVPVGLFGWIAFSLAFVLPNVSYAVSVLSDPFGWGWDLFGTKDYPWTPYAPGLVPYLQVPLLLVGLAWSVSAGSGILQKTFGEAEARRAAFPLAAYLIGVTLVFLALYLG